MKNINLQQEWERLSKFPKPFNFRDFANLDDSPDAEYLIQSMYDLYNLPDIQKIKTRAINLLELQQGDKVIELGCGLGHDIERMGNIVGITGNVIGVDKSKLMLQKAQSRSKQKNVKYLNEDATNLNFPDNSFDVSYADRLLVSQNYPDKVISELVRVTKPNGKICITDIDVGSIILYPYDNKLTPILKERWQNIVANPFIGRELQYKFKQNGLVNIQVIPDAYVVKSLEIVNKMIDYPRMIYDLYKLGKYTKNEALQMLDSLYKAEKDNMFLYGIIFFTVLGIKPN
ncbi:MAG: methyltransferase domain-containing protein [Gammaproteobacteria bacterium]|jgi:ubiquinone/menaquinone biosynthesis C-methylase UbiE